LPFGVTPAIDTRTAGRAARPNAVNSSTATARTPNQCRVGVQYGRRDDTHSAGGETPMKMTLNHGAGLTLTALTAVLFAQLPALPTAAQSDSIGFDLRIDHVGISVADLEESVDWYVDKLGFELVRPINRNPDSAMTIARLRRGDFNIELFEIEGAAPLPEYRRDPSADLRVHGLAHFAFQVDDVRAVQAELEAKGVNIVMPLTENRTNFFFVNDNSGNSFEFIQRR
jgi:methylmalonyl-CoA/ethylmalonyl-CoA epimerase